jgi:hypothetical protein
MAHDLSHGPKPPFVLNMDSPLAKGLVFWVPGYGSHLDYISGTHPTGTLQTYAPFVGHGMLGVDHNNTARQDYANDVGEAGDLTLFCWVEGTNASGNWNEFLFKKSAVNFTFWSSFGVLRLQIAGSTEASPTTAIDDGLPHFLAGRKSGANVTAMVDFFDTATQTDAGSLTSTANGTLLGSTGSETFITRDHMIWDYGLPDELLYELYTNPFGHYHELGKVLYFPAPPVPAGPFISDYRFRQRMFG